jgi:hypothetical protein
MAGCRKLGNEALDSIKVGKIGIGPNNNNNNNNNNKQS